jgi:hypothetical protein
VRLGGLSIVQKGPGRAGPATPNDGVAPSDQPRPGRHLDLDIITPPRYGRVVADAIPGARFEVLAAEAHQPFQEVPDLFNATVDTFWREIEARHSATQNSLYH